MEKCIFCRIVSGEEKAWKIYEDNDVVAVLDIFPVTEGHTLVILKEHVEDFFTLSEEKAAKLWNAAFKIAKAMKKALDAKTVNIILAEGIIRHAFLHVIPRYDYDLMPPVPDMENKRQLPKEEMKEIAKKLREALENAV